MSGRLLGGIAGVMAGLLIASGALGLNHTREAAAQEGAAIQATVQAAVNAWNSRDVANLRNYFTDQGFEAEFGFSRSDIQQLAEIIGDPPIVGVTVENVTVAESSATADVELSFGPFGETAQWSFIFEGGRWKVDNVVMTAPEIPSGATVVDVQLDEYEFIFDPSAITPGSSVAFPIENIGEEAHEFVLVRLTTDEPLLDLLQSEEEEPAGVEFLAFADADPGESNVVIPQAPLEAGRYGVVCFLPAPDGTPHAFLGMVSEFNVGSGGGTVSPITPPSTGSGGLAGGVSDGWPWAAIALGGLMAVVAAAAVVPVRR